MKTSQFLQNTWSGDEGREKAEEKNRVDTIVVKYAGILIAKHRQIALTFET